MGFNVLIAADLLIPEANQSKKGHGLLPSSEANLREAAKKAGPG